MKIITLTLNPAFDIHCKAEGFRHYHENVVETVSRDAGGKGVNISRALCSVGCQSTCMVIIGDENGEEFCNKLENDGLNIVPIRCKGRIRENITIHETGSHETRISFGGFAVGSSVLEDIERLIGSANEETVVTFTGSIPPGLDSKDVFEMLTRLKAQGVKVIVDSRSVSLEELVKLKPWLIKPNKDEIEKYIGRSLNGIDDAVTVARELHSSGIENAMITLGGDGAVLANSEGAFYAKPPMVDVLSTIGAGDSSIAGFVYGFVKGCDTLEKLSFAVAFGTASCMQEGTKPPNWNEIKNVGNEVCVFDF